MSRTIILALALALTALCASCVPRDCTGFKVDPAKQPQQGAPAESPPHQQEVP